MDIGTGTVRPPPPLPLFSPPPAPTTTLLPDTQSLATPLSPPHQTTDPGYRPLLLGWCFWLLASWATLGLGLHQTPLTWLVFAAMTGLMLVWPAWRLSAGAGHAAPAANLPAGRVIGWVLRDWLSLILIFQAIIWPHVIIRQLSLQEPAGSVPTGSWSLAQALWIDAAVAAWSLLIGAFVAMGCAIGTHGGRMAMMVLSLLVPLGEPLLLAALAACSRLAGIALPRWTMRISPIEAIYGLTRPTPLLELDPWRQIVVAVALAAAAGWGAVAWTALRRRSSRRELASL